MHLRKIYKKLKRKNRTIKKRSRKKKESKNYSRADSKNKEFVITKLSTENKELYGSVKPTEISKILNEKEKLEINPSMIQPVKEIKSLGIFKVVLNLHSEMQSISISGFRRKEIICQLSAYHK